MGFCDTFHFDEGAYIIKVRNSHARVLRKKHHAKVRMQEACSFSVGWGIGLAPATCGVSLIGSVYSARQIVILRQQARLIEIEIMSRNIEIPRRRKRDRVFGILLGVTGVCIGLGIAHGLHHLLDPITGSVVSFGGTIGAHQAPPTIDAIHNAASNLPSAAHGAMHAAQNVFSTELNHGLNSTAPGITAFPPAGNPAFVGGEQLGVAGMIEGQQMVGRMAAQAALENRAYNLEYPNRR
jgi:hypothetical protein